MSSGNEFDVDIDPADLDGPLPFHLLIDEHLKIQHVGRSIRRLYPKLQRGDSLGQWVTLDRPAKSIEHIGDLHGIAGRLVLFRLAGCDLQFRGQFLPLQAGDGMLLTADPQLADPDELAKHDLQLADFAMHDAITDSLFAIRARDITLGELKEAIERQRVLVRELDHRVKNNISAVLSLLALTRSEASDVTQYHEILDGRIRALDASHTLLSRGHWGPIDLGILADSVLAPFRGRRGRLELDAPPLHIPARLASPLAMSLHELGINAAKHGVWSGDSGVVCLQWQQSADTFKLKWSETDGPRPSQTMTEGTGLSIVRGFIEHELGGVLSIEPGESGITVLISLPGVAPDP